SCSAASLVRSGSMVVCKVIAASPFQKPSAIRLLALLSSARNRKGAEKKKSFFRRSERFFAPLRPGNLLVMVADEGNHVGASRRRSQVFRSSQRWRTKCRSTTPI